MNLNRTYANEFLGELSPAGQRAQQTLTPYQQFRVSGSVTPPRQAQGAAFISDPVAALDGLDPADDFYIEKQTEIFNQSPDLLRIPNVQQKIRQGVREHAEAQEYFKSDPTLIDFYAEQRGRNIAPSVALGELRKRAQDNTLKGAFLKSGGLVEEYEGLRDAATGSVDRFKMLDFINRKERESATRKANAPKELSAEGYGRLIQAQQDLESAESAIPSQEADTAKLKSDAFKKKFKRTPASEEDWSMAFDLAYPEVGRARSRLNSLQTSYASQYVMPPEFGGAKTAQPQWMDGPAILQANAAAASAGNVDTEMPALQEATSEGATPTKSAAAIVPVAAPQPSQESVPFTAPVTLPELTETDKISSKLSDDDIQAFTVSGVPDNPENPLDVEQSAQAQELEMVNLLSKAGLDDNPDSRRKVLLAVEAKSDPSVVRLGGKVYRFKDAETASEFRKRLSQK